MEITTFLFAGFVLLAVLGYLWLPQRYRNYWLLLASMVFLISWSWKFLIVLLALSLANYFIGRHLSTTGQQKSLLWTGILLNLVSLLVFKYSRFYLPALTSLLAKLGMKTGAGGIQILAPLGLSFIAVQMISYLVDIYYGRTPAERNIISFCLYVIYFPKILAGPIERAKPFLARLAAPQKWSTELVTRSLALVLVGVVRKIIFADTLSAMIPADAFQKPASYPAPLLVVWLLTYAFAIYNDFAGYTNIARGVSGLFGIELTNNFNVPYFARNFSEFWGRWHISLSNWLRDYIFFPLSRFLLIKVPRHDRVVHILVPPMVTMLVSGMWHGLSWNTLLWGGLQGGYLVLEQIGSLGRAIRPAGELPRWRQAISAAVVFFCVLMAWVPFHTSFGSAIQYWQSLFSPANWHFAVYQSYFAPALFSATYSRLHLAGLYLFPFFQAGFVLLPALGLDLVQSKNELGFLKWPSWSQGLLLALVILILFLLSFAEKGAPFIYQGF